MIVMTDEQKLQIKAENDELIKLRGYKINDWLPILDAPASRTVKEIKGRISVMNALVNIAFRAPTHIIKEWIEFNNLSRYLSNFEKELLEKENADLSEFEINSLQWYLESLWSFMWLTQLIDDIIPEESVGNNMASLLPNLEQGDSNEKIENIKSIRPEVEAYKMLDYYFRLHWYCVNERLNGRETKLNEGLIYERRKSLEWAFDESSDWDNVEMGT